MVPRRDDARFACVLPYGALSRRLEERTDGDRVRSEILGCWLRVVPDEGGRPLIRLAIGPAGDELLPTAQEAERHAKDGERRAREAEEQERSRRVALVAELRRRLGEG